MRFGIMQGPKLRVIDDASCCGLNSTVGLRESFQLPTVDRFAAKLVRATQVCPGAMPKRKGRIFDLRSAYKQFGLSEHDRQFVRLAMNKPGSQDPVLLGLNELPFGAVGSVAAVLRESINIWYIGFFALRLVWGAYFDF